MIGTSQDTPPLSTARDSDTQLQIGYNVSTAHLDVVVDPVGIKIFYFQDIDYVVGSLPFS